MTANLKEWRWWRLGVWAAPVALLWPTAASSASAAAPAQSMVAYMKVSGGSFVSLLPPDGKNAQAKVVDFRLRALPVSNAEFASFVARHPQWLAQRVAGSVLADDGYLGHWRSGVGWQAAQPMTHVSWHAARAFCESEGARLPYWHEWEYAAAADATRRDARADPVWRARILAWYGQPSAVLPAVGQTASNVHGVRDLHGLIWEWVEDFSALMVSGDNRVQGDGDVVRFCGAGAISANDRENYPVLMRMAMLSSLEAASTNRNLGFRCARDLPAARRPLISKGRP